MSITYEQAQAALNSSFIIHTSLGTVEFRLIKVEVSQRLIESSEFREPMVMIFSAPAMPLLDQDNYYIDHAVLGRLYLMIVPVIPPKNPPLTINNEPLMFYQIIFN